MLRRQSTPAIFRRAAFLSFGIACGLASAQTASAGSALSACEALSKADVAEVLGNSVSDGRALVRKDDVGVCSYATAGGGRVSILLRRSVARDWAESQIRRMKDAGSFRPTPGLGDQAFTFETRESGAVLCVFHRDFFVQVSAFRARDAVHAHQLVERLCRRILNRLGPATGATRIAPWGR